MSVAERLLGLRTTRWVALLSIGLACTACAGVPGPAGESAHTVVSSQAYPSDPAISRIASATSSPASVSSSADTCSLAPPSGSADLGPQTFKSYDFWKLHGVGTIIADEANPPQSITDLTRAAKVVVKGTITKAEVGIPLESEPYKIQNRNLPTSLITVTSSDGREYRFGLQRVISPDCVLNRPLPIDEYIFFFDQGDETVPGADVSCFNQSCVVAAGTPTGAYPLLKAAAGPHRNWWGDTADLRGLDAVFAFVGRIRK